MRSGKTELQINLQDIFNHSNGSLEIFIDLVVKDSLDDIVKNYPAEADWNKYQQVLRNITFTSTDYDSQEGKERLKKNLRQLKEILEVNEMVKKSFPCYLATQFKRIQILIIMGNFPACKEILKSIIDNASLKRMHIPALFIRGLLYLHHQEYQSALMDFEALFASFTKLENSQRKKNLAAYFANALLFASCAYQKTDKLSGVVAVLENYYESCKNKICSTNPYISKFVIAKLIQGLYLTKKTNKNINEYIENYLLLSEYNHQAYRFVAEHIHQDDIETHKVYAKLLMDTFNLFIKHNTQSSNLSSIFMQMEKKCKNMIMKRQFSKLQNSIKNEFISEPLLLTKACLNLARELYLAKQTIKDILYAFAPLSSKYPYIQIYLRTLFYCQFGFYDLALTELKQNYIAYDGNQFDTSIFQPLSSLLGHNVQEVMDIMISIMSTFKGQRVATNDESNILSNKLLALAQENNLLAQIYLVIGYHKADQQLARKIAQQINPDHPFFDYLFIFENDQHVVKILKDSMKFTNQYTTTAQTTSYKKQENLLNNDLKSEAIDEGNTKQANMIEEQPSSLDNFDDKKTNDSQSNAKQHIQLSRRQKDRLAQQKKVDKQLNRNMKEDKDEVTRTDKSEVNNNANQLQSQIKDESSTKAIRNRTKLAVTNKTVDADSFSETKLNVTFFRTNNPSGYQQQNKPMLSVQLPANSKPDEAKSSHATVPSLDLKKNEEKKPESDNVKQAVVNAWNSGISLLERIKAQQESLKEVDLPLTSAVNDRVEAIQDLSNQTLHSSVPQFNLFNNNSGHTNATLSAKTIETDGNIYIHKRTLSEFSDKIQALQATFFINELLNLAAYVFKNVRTKISTLVAAKIVADKNNLDSLKVKISEQLIAAYQEYKAQLDNPQMINFCEQLILINAKASETTLTKIDQPLLDGPIAFDPIAFEAFAQELEQEAIPLILNYSFEWASAYPKRYEDRLAILANMGTIVIATKYDRHYGGLLQFLLAETYCIYAENLMAYSKQYPETKENNNESILNSIALAKWQLENNYYYLSQLVFFDDDSKQECLARYNDLSNRLSELEDTMVAEATTSQVKPVTHYP